MHMPSHYRGIPLVEAFRKEQARVLKDRAALVDAYPYKTVAAEMRYSGPEVPTFTAYLRWGRNRCTVARIYCAEGMEQRGRVPKIVAALEELVSVVEFENVCNTHLADHLYRRGFRYVVDGPVLDGSVMGQFPGSLRRIKGQDVSRVSFHELPPPLTLMLAAPGAPYGEAA